MDKLGQEVIKVREVQLALLGRPVVRELLVLQGHVVKLDIRAALEGLVLRVQQVNVVTLDPQDHRVKLVFLDRVVIQVAKVCREQMEIQVFPVYLEQQVVLDYQVPLELLETLDLLDLLVVRDSQVPMDPLEQLEFPVLLAHKVRQEQEATLEEQVTQAHQDQLVSLGRKALPDIRDQVATQVLLVPLVTVDLLGS